MTVSRSRCNPVSCSRLLGCPGHARAMRVPSSIQRTCDHTSGKATTRHSWYNRTWSSQSSHESRSLANKGWPSLVTARRHSVIPQLETPLLGTLRKQVKSSTHWARPPVAARAPVSANRDVPTNCPSTMSLLSNTIASASPNRSRTSSSAFNLPGSQRSSESRNDSRSPVAWRTPSLRAAPTGDPPAHSKGRTKAARQYFPAPGRRRCCSCEAQVWNTLPTARS